MQKPTFKIHTFGCKVNTYDTGLLQKRLAESGWKSVKDEPQIHILNSCAVTAAATKEAIKSVRRLKSRHPLSKVVITGCAAQVDTEKFESVTGADLVVANSHKGHLDSLMNDLLKDKITQKIHKSNIFKKEDLEYGGGLEEGHTRSFLKIQDGCNSFCTYCVIPFARGKSRSLSIDRLVEKVRELEDRGIREVVLTGVHVGDYQHDFGDGQVGCLEDLLEHLLKRTRTNRFRLTSLEPVELTPRLLELYQDERLCPHFHMSIQSATTSTLKRMKRKYTAQDVETSLVNIEKLGRDAFVGMDVIVGFAGESEEEFEDTYSRLANLPWTRIHVFPYSERPGTIASRFEDDVRQEIKKERSKRLRQLSSSRYAEKALEQIGTIKSLLPLQSKTGARGLTRDYWPVHIQKQSGWSQWEEQRVRITGFDPSLSNRMNGFLTGELVDPH